MAELALAATKFGWQCTECRQLFDAMWRPVKPEKAWHPPLAYNWMIDKPPYNYCPICGVPFTSEENQTDELRVE